MATIALRNSPSGNCHLRLKRHPKREKLWQHLGKSHALREKRRRNRARWRDSRVEEAYISTHVPVRDCATKPASPTSRCPAQTQLVWITFPDSGQPLAISTQSPAHAPVDIEVRPSNLPTGVRELWHTLRRHPQPPRRQSPSFLLKVFIAVEDNEA
jgi:hypothetical protein